MATFPANSKVAGISTGLTSDLNSVYGLLQSILGRVILPSGDTSGATDSAAGVAALSAYKAVELIPGATYYVTQGQWVLGLGQRLRGNGATIKLAGASLGPALTIYSSTGSSRFQTAQVDDVIIDGSAGPSNSIGLQCGDISQVSLSNVRVQNFGGGTGVGFSFFNQNSFAEQLHGQIYAVNCDQCMVFSVGASGSNSFERISLTFWGEPNAGGYLLLMRNGAQLYQGRLALYGNIQGAGGAAIIMENTATIQKMQLDVGVENDATSGTGAQTINFVTANNKITDCYGLIEFLQVAGGTAWTASNNSGNMTNFLGPVLGDTTLPHTTSYNT